MERPNVMLKIASGPRFSSHTKAGFIAGTLKPKFSKLDFLKADIVKPEIKCFMETKLYKRIVRKLLTSVENRDNDLENTII